MVEAEQVVNSRPMTYINMSENDLDLEILTPQKFLAVSQPQNLPILAEDDPNDPEFHLKPTNRTKVIQTWKQGQYYLNKFWYAWRDNYLLNLRERHLSDRFPKVKSQTFRPPKLGEIVLVKNENFPRGSWEIGKVCHLNEGQDGQIRSVQVKIPNCRDLITRPVSLLFPLEIQSDTNSENSISSQLVCETDLSLLIVDKVEMSDEIVEELMGK